MNDVQTSEKVYVTWEQIYTAAENIVDQIRQTLYRVDRIIAIEKGGVIPAGLILQAFPKASFNTIRCETYKGMSPDLHGPILTKGINFQSFNDPYTLVVDEICDSGRTFTMLHGYLPRASYVSLFVREYCLVNPEYWGAIAQPGTWLVFPWEGLEPTET